MSRSFFVPTANGCSHVILYLTANGCSHGTNTYLGKIVGEGFRPRPSYIAIESIARIATAYAAIQTYMITSLNSLVSPYYCRHQISCV